jgi:hypothetical protein
MPMPPLKIARAALVYQTGIANVFALERFSSTADKGRKARRLLQSDFRTCENFALGLQAAGVDVATYSCNRAGDIADAHWTPGLADCPFRDQARPVNR